MTTTNPDAAERLARALQQQHDTPEWDDLTPGRRAAWIEEAAGLIATIAIAGLDLTWTPHRVFWDGETVPAGTCVLDEGGDVYYLDDTADCSDDCEDDCDCSHDVGNFNLGPLVEVPVPDYAAAVAADAAARARRVQP